MKPQKFDLISPQFKANPNETFEVMRQMGEVVRVKIPLVGPVWMTTSYQATDHLLKDHERFVQQGEKAGRSGIAGLKWWMPRSIKVLTNNMLLKDEPDHRRLRNLVELAFQKHSVTEMRSRIEAIVDQLLDELERVANEQGSVDFVQHFARPFPLAVICDLMGLPTKDRPLFSKWAKGLTNSGSVLSLLSAVPKLWKMNRYFKNQFAMLRETPQAGLLSSLVTAQQDGDCLSEDELLAMGFLLLFAGHETTVHALSGSVWALLSQPDKLELLKSEEANIETAVDELLRYLTPVQMTKVRFAVEDCDYFGQKIKRGDYCMGLLAAANHDPQQFIDPEKLILTRQPNPHLAFGTGIHVCLGLKLAKAELAIALKKLFQRFPEARLFLRNSPPPWEKRIGLRSLKSLPLQI